MLSIVDCSLELAAQRVRFFPCRPNSKLPAVDHYAERATSDAQVLQHLFDSDRNSGIACGKVAEDLYLLGLDIDCKPGKPGFETLEKMEVLGQEFPPTWSQRTPSGGEHRLFWSPVPIRQAVDILPGIDLRSEGGYLVGPGSQIDGKYYEPLNHLEIARLPEWAIAKWKKEARVISIESRLEVGAPDPVMALKRAVEYLQSLPPVPEGKRNAEGFKAAARLKDIGVQAGPMRELLLEYWKCEPMVSDAELSQIVNSAFKYTKSELGCDAPDKIFGPVPPEDIGPKDAHPVDVFNRDHFLFVGNGTAKVCWETTDEDGHFHLERMLPQHFHLKHAWDKFYPEGSEKPIAKSRHWINDENRRTVTRIVFHPEGHIPAGHYNLWRGFAVKPAGGEATYSPEAHRGFQMFLEHCRENVCQGDAKLNVWLIGFFAHLFQKPGVRPRTALVIRGLKGTGKNVLIDRIGEMIGTASAVISNKKFLTTNFNAVTEQKLLITLDEAFWSGDKTVEGVLKSLVTEQVRQIERKGEDPYPAKVFDRIVILGNDDRIVHATADERRWAVFEMGNKRRQDGKFFGDMKKGLVEHRGNELLMRYFLDFDLSTVDVDQAPRTAALQEQMDFSLTPYEQWWKECLTNGKLEGSVFPTWPLEVSTNDLYAAYVQYQKQHPSYGLPISKTMAGHIFGKLCPSARREAIRKEGERFWGVYLPTLALARANWNEAKMTNVEWPDADE